MNNVGIFVSGGPAPGINGVISSVFHRASSLGWKVYGMKNGFRAISSQDEDYYIKFDSVPPNLYSLGGSILGTSRFNPFQSDETEGRLIENLRALDIRRLVVIGGEGSAWISRQISVRQPNLQVIHVPKTIDNDLILPNQYPSFGFETARSVGTTILKTLKTDAKTCGRWFLVTSMGRKAGFLALGLGVAAGANITLIPEEFFGKKITPHAIARLIADSIEMRLKKNRNYGVVVLAEGLVDMLDPDGDDKLANAPRDEMGRIRYNILEIADVIEPYLRDLCPQIKLNQKTIGYELRCHDPVSFDIEYTTFLGYGAVQLLNKGLSGHMVTKDYDALGSIALSSMCTGDNTMISRHVNLNSDYYQVARSFMDRAD